MLQHPVVFSEPVQSTERTGQKVSQCGVVEVSSSVLSLGSVLHFSAREIVLNIFLIIAINGHSGCSVWFSEGLIKFGSVYFPSSLLAGGQMRAYSNEKLVKVISFFSF